MKTKRNKNRGREAENDFRIKGTLTKESNDNDARSIFDQSDEGSKPIQESSKEDLANSLGNYTG